MRAAGTSLVARWACDHGSTPLDCTPDTASHICTTRLWSRNVLAWALRGCSQSQRACCWWEQSKRRLAPRNCPAGPAATVRRGPLAARARRRASGCTSISRGRPTALLPLPPRPLNHGAGWQPARAAPDRRIEASWQLLGAASAPARSSRVVSSQPGGGEQRRLAVEVVPLRCRSLHGQASRPGTGVDWAGQAAPQAVADCRGFHQTRRTPSRCSAGFPRRAPGTALLWGPCSHPPPALHPAKPSTNPVLTPSPHICSLSSVQLALSC